MDSVTYFECKDCEFIFADPNLLEAMDSGQVPCTYDDSYWQTELASARERAFGPSLARVAETILYARRPIERFIDIASGPGYLLDALATYLPHATERFFGVERYPPPSSARSMHANFMTGDLSTLSGQFQAGVCIEVLEHLTPSMVKALAFDLARISDPEALYTFNTGLVDFVKNEDPGYLDPYQRGHVCIWSVNAARRVFEPAGFVVKPIPGKTWAFVVEFTSNPKHMQSLSDRIWSPHPDNRKLLNDPQMGTAMYLLGLESARAYNTSMNRQLASIWSRFKSK